MKKIIVFSFLLLNLFSFSQEKKIVKNGYITFISNAIIEFENLTLENESVTFINKISKLEMNVSVASVKKIMDISGEIIYETGNLRPGSIVQPQDPKPVIVEKSADEKLKYQSASKIYMNGQKLSNDKLESLLKVNPNAYNQYKKGKSGSTLGNVLIGGGIGLFIGGGISNLMASDTSSGGSPALLIVGLATAVVGIPVKLGGVKNIKQAVNSYNSLPKKQVSFVAKSDLNLVASANGIGLQWKF
ncbi:MAG: hypothetical protein M0D53_11635 [Flavobacterium sp. JAD_PAG50586_2]|nr:MAG: hypothetical protein M0D53_11635 [Flavobacterium sp. JAD_PAG50586_2]